MTRNSMSILVEIAQKMNSSVELSEILPGIVEIAKQYMEVKRVSVFLKEQDKLLLKAYAGFNPELPVIINIGEGVAGEVALSGRMKVVNRSSAPNRQDFYYAASSYLSVPLRDRDGVLGVLNLTDKYDDYFDDEDIYMAEYIASQCSLAVERYKLYLDMKGTERMKVIGLLRASIAHDIRNLLGIIETYLTLIEDCSDKEEAREYFDAIHMEIRRVQGLTSDIIDYSKQRADLKYEYFNLKELCSTVVRQLSLALSSDDIDIVLDSKKDVFIDGDKDRLYRIIFNIVNNASQAIPEGRRGRVVIRCRNRGDYASISVCDNGKGIPESMLNNIFDPFITSGKSKGTGLGLAIVKEITEAHGGRVKVRSAEGKYTTFSILIPKKRMPER